MNIYYFFIAFLLNQTIEACTFYKKESKINLLNNGYENILIVINNDVPENFEIIDRIRSLFTEASSLLFNATRARAYFKEISILIPSTWKLNYFNRKPIPYSSWETIDNGDICIEKRDELLSNAPFVINYAGECGESALHIHLSIDYLVKEKKSLHFYGSFKNVLVGQWAQFRYGVFDELSSNSNDDGDFYYNSNGEIDANRCTSTISGKLRDAFSQDGNCKTFLPNGLPDSSCVFEDDIFENESGIQFGSLMYKSFLPQINSFCDDDPSNMNTHHNSFASNLQNRLCSGKSVWDVRFI
jgi:calcium-activated chloride channel regulator 3/4